MSVLARHPFGTPLRVARAIATNVVARLFPRWYLRLAGTTGRGNEASSPRQVADYFWQCFDEYLAQLGLARVQAPGFLAGKRVLEYGPGDMPGVALLLVAHGAESVTCVDRFPMMLESEFNARVMETLLADLEGEARERAKRCFAVAGDPRSGLAPDRIHCTVNANGLVGESAAFPLVISRAVLEVVNDLAASLADMRRALTDDGVMLHKVHLESYGLHRDERLDFLTWPTPLWRLMYGAKPVPNRLRVNRYRELLGELGFAVQRLDPIALAEQREIDAVRPRLAREFRGLCDEDLACLNFWLVARKR